MPMPDFTEVLDMARRSAGLSPEESASAKGSRRPRGAAAHLHQLADRLFELVGRATPAATSFDPYSEHQHEVPVAPQVAKPTDPKSVAAELRITAQMSFSDLNRLRREFALANHPDRVGAGLQENATHRMMVANMLIDREIKRRGSARRTTR